MLARYSATQQQYIVITMRDGTVEHYPGYVQSSRTSRLEILPLFRPCVKFHDPLRMDSVTVQNATALDANEVLVVYRYDNETKKVSRRIQHGPSVYIPTANEWWVCVLRDYPYQITSSVT